MSGRYSMALLLLVVASSCQAATIYQCHTKQGVLFADRPCGEQAQQMQVRPAAKVNTKMAVTPTTKKQLAEAAKKRQQDQVDALQEKVSKLQQQQAADRSARQAQAPSAEQDKVFIPYYPYRGHSYRPHYRHNHHRPSHRPPPATQQPPYGYAPIQTKISTLRGDFYRQFGIR